MRRILDQPHLRRFLGNLGGNSSQSDLQMAASLNLSSEGGMIAPLTSTLEKAAMLDLNANSCMASPGEPSKVVGGQHHSLQCEINSVTDFAINDQRQRQSAAHSRVHDGQQALSQDESVEMVQNLTYDIDMAQTDAFFNIDIARNDSLFDIDMAQSDVFLDIDMAQSILNIDMAQMQTPLQE